MKRLALLGAVSVVALSACQPAGADTIKIGFIGPLTGEAASYGIDPLAGIEAKIDEINAAGGIDGKMIEIVAEDGKCTGADAASAAQKLIGVDHVVAILGGQCSGETLAAAPIAEAAGVVMISSISSSPDVSKAGDFIFRDYPNDALKTKAMAAYFKAENLQKVAIISENTDFATGFRDALVQDVGAANVVFNESVEPQTKDYRTLMARLKNVDFDIFVANGQYPASIAAMAQQMREAGINAPIISHDVADTIEMITVGGDAVEGFRVINVQSIEADSPFGKAMAAKNVIPQAALVIVAHGYDAMGVLGEAMKAVGTKGTAIRDYLYDLKSYTGAIGTFSFDANGDVEGIDYALKEVKNGAFVTVKAVPVQ